MSFFWKNIFTAWFPSEMPASYEMEALKVQAVCARSFAVNALNNPRFEDYGADVDDSTATQVYNNTSEDLRVNEAVDACAGQILTWEGVPVQTYFYSTSCGAVQPCGCMAVPGSPALYAGRSSDWHST